MNRKTFLIASVALTALLLTACASLEDLVYPPQVSLRNVNVENIDFRVQTFILAFDVTNPNPFPLPISTIRYGLELDGHHIVSGQAVSAITVPAGSGGAFAISVSMNLMKTSPKLMYVVRDGTRRNISYAIEGELGINLEYMKHFKFEDSGSIRLQASKR